MWLAPTDAIGCNAKVCREEPVAYLPQTVFLKDGSDDRYLISSRVNLTDSSPFYVTNANQYTFFIRYRWDGNNPSNNNAGVLLNVGWQYGTAYKAGDLTSGGTGSSCLSSSLLSAST